jgi:arylsulfatase A-like enzyme
MMAAMDDAIGAVVGRIAQLDLEGKTLIFFISDNGGPVVNGSNNGPLRGYKAQTWEGGIRVPFLVRRKGRLPAGKVYDQPVIQLDVLPTALDAAGVELRPEWKLDGVDLLPYFEGRVSKAPHDALYWRFAQHMAIRMRDWKLVKAPDGPTPELRRRTAGDDATGARLFNLAADIGQKTDLAEREPEKVKGHASRLESLECRARRAPLVRQPTAIRGKRQIAV